MAKKSSKEELPKQRNIYAVHAHNRVAGSHNKTYKSQRSKDKAALKKGQNFDPFLLCD